MPTRHPKRRLQKVWPHGAANAGTFHYAAQSYTQVSGLTPSVAARSIAYDSDRNRTESTSAVNRTAKTLVTSTTTTGTTQTLAQITLNGLPISSTNAQGQTTLMVYDALGRLEATNDPRIGTSSVLYHANTAFVQFSIAPDNSMTGFTYDSAGRVAAQTNNNNKIAYFKYDAAGNLTHTWGDTTNPVWYEYNDLGQKTKMHTYRSGTWTGAALPSGFSLAGDVTIWNYQLATGLLDSKQDATSQYTYYQYDTMSRASKRTDARGWVTNYTYTLAGLPLTTDYTDAFTTDVTFNYDRAGRIYTVADASGSRTFGYYDTGTDPNPDLDLLNKSARVKSETLSAYFGSHVVNYGYQYAVAGRANGALASVKIDTGSYYTVGYGYDTVGRLGTVSYNTATPFTYSYVPNANLVDTVAQSTTGYKRDYDYEANSNRRSSMKNLWGNLTASTVESRLTYDLLGQRNTEKTAGTAYMTALGRAAEVGVHADYLYTDRSELEYTAKYQLSAGWGVGSYRNNTDRDYTYDPIGNRTAEIVAGFLGSYTPNALNQYSSAPGAASLTYDLNGNLKTDGTRNYDYDGENRLIKVTQGVSVWNYAYDYLGRRIRKWGTGLTEQRFIYDGWNLIAETDAVGTLTRRYAWGLDVSGTNQGAGGVGGLLLIQDGSSTYYPIYDASHNVIGLYNGSGGIDSAYEYDPFGKVQTSTGAYAAANPFRYSTKYTDNETSLTYYGHRYYSSTLGRFINRDPIEEAGGINLYGFCGNDGVNRYDYLGMDETEPEEPIPEPPPDVVITPNQTTFYDSDRVVIIGRRDSESEKARIRADGEAAFRGYQTQAAVDDINSSMHPKSGGIDLRTPQQRAADESSAREVEFGRNARNSGLLAFGDMGSGVGIEEPFGIQVGQSVVEMALSAGGIFFEPLDWALTAREIYNEPKNPWSYAGLIPIIPAGFGKLAKAAENIKRLDPNTIRLSHPAKLSSPFSNPSHGVVKDLADALKKDPSLADRIPPIEIAKIKGEIWSANNRRLRAFQEAGIPIQTIPASKEAIRQIKARAPWDR